MTFFTKWANGLGLNHKIEGQNSRPVLLSTKKGPIRARLNGHIHFLEMFKANLPKSGNKHKNSAKVDTFIFVWETLDQENQYN